MSARLRTLRDSIAIEPEVAPKADPFGAEIPGVQEHEVARRGVLVRVSPQTWRALKIAAIERRVTVQALMLEGIEFVLNRPNEEPAPGGPPGP